MFSGSSLSRRAHPCAQVDNRREMGEAVAGLPSLLTVPGLHVRQASRLKRSRKTVQRRTNQSNTSAESSALTSAFCQQHLRLTRDDRGRR